MDLGLPLWDGNPDLMIARSDTCRRPTRPRRDLLILCLRLACGLGLAAGLPLLTLAQQPPQRPLDKVKLQLKWTHQFQFAGYYAAAEKGFYREAGLEVELIEGRPGVDFIREVVTGKAQFGTEMPDLLLRRSAGDPVVVLAAIFQHSPVALICRADSGIKSPHDLVGRRVMLRSASNAELRAMITKEGVTLDRIRFQENSFDPDDLAQGRADAMSLYLTVYAPEFKQRGVAVTVLEPINYGVDFYGDCLFTTERQLSQHPQRVRAFREASLRGWEYAMDHPREIAQLIHDKYAPQRTVESLVAEAEAMEPLLLPKFVEVGRMNPGRWRHIGDTYAKLGMLPANYSLHGFLYDPEQPSDDTWLKWLAAIGCLGLAAAGVFFIFIRQLGSAVKERTTELRESEGRFRTLVESAPEAIFVQSEGRFLYANLPMAKLLGADRPEDLLGKDCFDRVAPEFRDTVRERIRLQQETQGPVPPAQLEFVRLDGLRLPVETTAVAIQYQGRAAHLVFVRDATERIQAESVTQARLRLMEFAGTHSLEEVLVATLDELEALTGSRIAYYHFVQPGERTLNLQAWSTRTSREKRVTGGQDRKSESEPSGAWMDCVRQGRPVIHQERTTLPGQKGEAPGTTVARELVAPVFRNNKVVAVLGVGDKQSDYSARDLETVSRLADLAWDIAERKRAEEELGKRMEELLAWENLTLGREARILDLKQEVNDLLAKLGRPARYDRPDDKTAPPFNKE